MIEFYISRNPENYGSGYEMTTYPPKKNSNSISSWWYWAYKNERYFNVHLLQKDINDLGIKVNYGECLNLQSGKRFTIEEAEELDTNEMQNF